MDEPLRIFISHNAGKCPQTEKFLTELEAMLKDQRGADQELLFMPFVDRDLEPGAPWRGVLYNWMSVCDIAVILLDEQTKNSQWVPREATIFVWRQHLDSSFKVLPILLDGIDKKILFEPPFQDLGLNDVGFKQCAHAAEVVEALRAEKKPQNNRRLSRLEGKIGKIESSILQTFLEDSHELLDLEPTPYAAAVRTKRAIAASLLSYGFRKGPLKESGQTYPSAKALRVLAMNGGKLEQVREISEAIRFYWVDPLASVKLLSAKSRRADHVKVIVIRLNIESNVWPQDVIHDYFAQAYSQDKVRPYDLIRVEALSIQSGYADERLELRERIRSALWSFAHQSGEARSATDNTWIDQVFKDREGEVYCWFVQSDGVKIDLIIDMQKEFRYLRMVYLCFDESCLCRKDVDYLEPPLVEKLEQEAMLEIATSMTYLSGPGGNG
jgi:hypothetical protein